METGHHELATDGNNSSACAVLRGSSSRTSHFSGRRSNAKSDLGYQNYETEFTHLPSAYAASDGCVILVVPQPA
jgi:hypothetical protein